MLECELRLPPSSSLSTTSLLNIVRMQLIHKSITVLIQHTYHKIITEELVAFVKKLSVMVPYSKLVVLICFIREQ